jgi:peroxiredoxin
MAQLRQDYDQFRERNTEVVVVGPEGPAEFQRYWADHNLPFTGLPDPIHTVLKLYGQEVNLFKLGRMPAQLIIDQQGVVRYAHFGKSMQDIPPTLDLLELLDELNLQTEAEAIT